MNSRYHASKGKASAKTIERKAWRNRVLEVIKPKQKKKKK